LTPELGSIERQGNFLLAFIEIPKISKPSHLGYCFVDVVGALWFRPFFDQVVPTWLSFHVSPPLFPFSCVGNLLPQNNENFLQTLVSQFFYSIILFVTRGQSEEGNRNSLGLQLQYSLTFFQIFFPLFSFSLFFFSSRFLRFAPKELRNEYQQLATKMYHGKSLLRSTSDLWRHHAQLLSRTKEASRELLADVPLLPKDAESTQFD
jgi:hypothetical protein